MLVLQVSQGSTDPRSIAVATLQVAIDQGSEPTLKWIFGQGFPKLHPFGLSPLINDQCYTSTVTVSNTDPRSIVPRCTAVALGSMDQGSVLAVHRTKTEQ